jgi:hypothetical protein
MKSMGTLRLDPALKFLEASLLHPQAFKITSYNQYSTDRFMLLPITKAPMIPPWVLVRIKKYRILTPLRPRLYHHLVRLLLRVLQTKIAFLG